MDQPVTEPALRVRDIAAMLNVDDSTVYRWIEKGSLPAYRFEDTIRVAPEDFEAFRKRSVYKPARSLTSATDMDGRASSRSTLPAESASAVLVPPPSGGTSGVTCQVPEVTA